MQCDTLVTQMIDFESNYKVIWSYKVIPEDNVLEPKTADRSAKRRIDLQNGEPCKHPGCLSHISHPCEICRRIAGGLKPEMTDL